MKRPNPWVIRALLLGAMFWAWLAGEAHAECVQAAGPPPAPACVAYHQHLEAAYQYQAYRANTLDPHSGVYIAPNLSMLSDLAAPENYSPDDPYHCAALDAKFLALHLPTDAVKDTRFADSEKLIEQLGAAK